jgi:cellulose biosynthesis protein BcsQ
LDADMPQVFISYARQDADFVRRQIEPVLRSMRLTMWVDIENLDASVMWSERISAALEASDWYVLLMSPDSETSDAVRKEVDWILSRRPNRLIPILVSPCNLTNIHPGLPAIHHIDCVDEEAAMRRRLLRALIHAGHEIHVQEATKIREMSAELEESTEERDELREQVHGLTKQLHQISEFDGDWVGEGHGRSVEFRPRSERRTPIVSLVNLKGGVGKSTLAVNLAAMYFNRKGDSKRVLIVDLDFQTSATTLCLHSEDRRDSMRSRLNVSRLFEDGSDAQTLFQCAKRIGRSPGMIVPGDDSLARRENKALAKWLTKQSELDVRFHLRHILHSKEVEDAFDLVILDCPPRLHVASVNALAASDWVLVPMQLDQTSADSVPRLLAWLKTFRQEGLCPELDVLGVVANMKSFSRKELLHREENIWLAVATNCQGEWPFGEVPMLKTPIQLSPAVSEASEEPGKFACEDPRLRPAFVSLLQEIEPKLFSTKERVRKR